MGGTTIVALAGKPSYGSAVAVIGPGLVKVPVPSYKRAVGVEDLHPRPGLGQSDPVAGSLSVM
jgi:hypothetical protein